MMIDLYFQAKTLGSAQGVFVLVENFEPLFGEFYAKVLRNGWNMNFEHSRQFDAKLRFPATALLGKPGGSGATKPTFFVKHFTYFPITYQAQGGRGAGRGL